MKNSILKMLTMAGLLQLAMADHSSHAGHTSSQLNVPVSSQVDAAPVYSSPVAAAAAAAPATSQPVSTGNLYYYYYPVAAYPIDEKSSSIGGHHASSSSHYGGGGGGGHHTTYQSYGGGHGGGLKGGGYSDFGPLAFILIPLVLLLLAVPLLGLFVNNNNNGIGRSFENSINNPVSSLQAEVNVLLKRYMGALESQECMDRMMCQVGVRAQILPHKDMIFSGLSLLKFASLPTPKLDGRRIELIKEAALQNFSDKTCERYTCHPPNIIQERIWEKLGHLQQS